MKIKNKGLFYTSLGILCFMILSFFIKISYESGFNYEVQDSLLGILIFHNAYVLATYVIILALMFAKSVDF